jgi:hypothetical protein
MQESPSISLSRKAAAWVLVLSGMPGALRALQFTAEQPGSRMSDIRRAVGPHAGAPASLANDVQALAKEQLPALHRRLDDERVRWTAGRPIVVPQP